MDARPWLDHYPEGVNWDFAPDQRPVYDLLDQAVEQFAGRPALEFLGRRYNYCELGKLVARAAKGLQKLGVGKGVNVGLFLPNCPQFVVAYYAVLKAGGTVVNFSPLYAERELVYQVEDSKTDIMITLDLDVLYPKMAKILRETCLQKLVVGSLADALPFPKNLLFRAFRRGEVASVNWDDKHFRWNEIIKNDGAFEPVNIDPANDIAVLQYTGGTTGVSKGAVLTHTGLVSNVGQLARWDPDSRPGAERTLAVLPFFHVFSMTVVMNLGISIGAELIIHPRFELDAVLRDLQKKKPTLMAGVPTMYTAINNHPGVENMDLGSLRYCMSGGAPLPLDIKEKFEALTSSRLVEGYGLTETSGTASANPITGVNKENSVGLPLPGTEIIITDTEDPTKRLAIGENGEICIAGPQIMAGYWGRDEATSETLIDGFLRTGDVGYMDAEGYVFIIDRMKDLIIAGGFNIFPRHVEEAIQMHPAVGEVTVIGIPDDYRGQSVKAFIAPRDGAVIDVEEMKAFLADKLGRHEIPREFEFRDELPKTMVGKLSKKELVAKEKAKYDQRKNAETLS